MSEKLKKILLKKNKNLYLNYVILKKKFIKETKIIIFYILINKNFK